MQNKTAIIILGVIVTSLFSWVDVYGQQDKLTQQVQVVRPYEPSISDAFKLNMLPQIEDTIRITPTFSYNLTLRPVTVDFPVNLISPARMVAEPLTRASWGYVKAGFGNYASPLAEVYYSSTRQKDYSYGASLKYNGSFGNIKLDNDEKVDGDFHHFGIGAFGKKIFSKSVLDGGIDFTNFSYGFYGYDTTQAALPIPSDVERQKQQKFNVGLNYYSTHSDSTHLNHMVNVRFANFADKFSNSQNTIELKASFDKFFKIEKVGASLSIKHHSGEFNLTPTKQTLINFAPWIGLFGKQWRTQAGVSTTIEVNEWGTKTHFYPIALLSYDIIGNYFIPYFQFNGYLKNNHYSEVLAENPWAVPGINMANTSHKFILKGGIKGNLSPRVAYNISGSYSLIDSAYFFVNAVDPSNLFLSNSFDVIYDNIQHTHFVGELTIAPTTSLKLALQAEYNTYEMNELENPWHKPNYAGRATLSYNLRDKILVHAGLILEGKRDIKGFNDEVIEIDGILDVNLGLEYRLNKRASAFLNFNNITANRYHHWYLYPTQGFNMRGGITYAF
ncbi:TonB-dependent receptor [Perlabentimonas gracilis]|uniref:hypothetical protein n=1 Tax=Perlabentimonas gracilis TaxID=2715279 RepID=UPI00140A3D0E|nr:hypothetical protein [Perlabentimonas gracilis]NHB68675.1 hypothetical protein [Perlabentimonas gracilis]